MGSDVRITWARLAAASAAATASASPSSVSGFRNLAVTTAVRGQLLSMPEVDHVALLSGEHDILLRVRARDAVSLRDTVLTRLQDIPEVHSTQTVLIFEEATPSQGPHDPAR